MNRRNPPGGLTPARLVLLATAVLGLAFSWYATSINQGLGETGRVAAVLLQRGELADPYLVPTGPTAHVSPVIAAYMALVYAACGVGTAASRFVLGLGATAIYAVGGYVAMRLLDLHDVPRRLRWAAAIAIACTPVPLFFAVGSLRIWDQALAATILVCGWYFVAQIQRGAAPLAGGVRFGMLAGFGGLVSPALLPPFALAGAWISWRAWRGGVGPRWWGGGAAAVALVLAFLVPWGLRNQQALGQFIVTRSNFGLELAIGNRGLDPRLPYVANIRALPLEFPHPFDNAATAQKVARLGEVAFMRQRRDEALGWILNDIPRFIQRSLFRASLWLFPAYGEFFPVLGPAAPFAFWNLLGLATGLSLLASVVLRERMMEGLLFVVLPMAPYFLTHMNQRYAFVVFFSSVAFNAIMAAHVLERRRGRLRPGPVRAGP